MWIRYSQKESIEWEEKRALGPKIGELQQLKAGRGE